MLINEYTYRYTIYILLGESGGPEWGETAVGVSHTEQVRI